MVIKTQTANTIPEEEVNIEVPENNEVEWRNLNEKVRRMIFRKIMRRKSTEVSSLQKAFLGYNKWRIYSL